MVNKCAAPKCESGYISNDNKRIAKFNFPLKNPDLNQLWTRFVNRTDWKATEHFEEKFIHRLEKSTLKLKMSPVPSIYPCELLQSPASLPTLQTSGTPPRKRVFQEEELDTMKSSLLYRILMK